MKVWYFNRTTKTQGNFGDLLGGYIPNELLGGPKTELLSIKDPELKLVSVGSVLREGFGLEGNAIIWGSGMMLPTDNAPKGLDIRGVRGYYTLRRLVDQGYHEQMQKVSIGDPALLLPMLYQPKTTKKYKLGVIPHYVDNEIAEELFGDVEGVKIINLLTNEVEPIIDQIAECDYCISSSLHGVIVAHAYNIPCAWIRMSDQLMGDKEGNFKFKDYYSSVQYDEQWYEGNGIMKKGDDLHQMILDLLDKGEPFPFHKPSSTMILKRQVQLMKAWFKILNEF